MKYDRHIILKYLVFQMKNLVFQSKNLDFDRNTKQFESEISKYKVFTPWIWNTRYFEQST